MWYIWNFVSFAFRKFYYSNNNFTLYYKIFEIYLIFKSHAAESIFNFTQKITFNLNKIVKVNLKNKRTFALIIWFSLLFFHLYYTKFIKTLPQQQNSQKKESNDKFKFVTVKGERYIKYMGKSLNRETPNDHFWWYRIVIC